MSRPAQQVVQSVGERPTTRTMNGGDALAEMLKVAGTGSLFGMAGFQLLPFYEALRARGMPHRLINDERCGAFAADAHARVTHQPGVCDATLGPGATNLVTGLVESLNAGIPQIVLVGDAHRDHAGKNMTQEGRQVDILRPAVKEVIRVEGVQRIPELVRRAFAVATAGRPGPVVLDVPEDVCHGSFDFPEDAFWIDERTLSAPAHRPRPDAADVEHAAKLLAAAERPLLLVGGGIHLSQAYEALQRLAEDHAIPVAHTISGKGAIACTHPLSVGLFGRYSRVANDLIAKADCLLVVGCKLGEIATKRFQLFPPALVVIQVDIVPEELGRTARVHLPLQADARMALQDIAAALAGDAPPLKRARPDYLAEIATRKAAWQLGAAPLQNSDERPIHMARLLAELNRVMPERSILVADGGFAGHWSGLLYDTKAAGRHFIADRGFASIGYGLPGCIGAQLAAPDIPVVGITGDGGLNMVLGELETARRVGAAFTLIVINNAASGYVKALQHAMYDGRYQSSDLLETDYAALATTLGCHGVRVESPAGLAPALHACMEERTRPSVMDVVVTRDPAQMLPAVDNRTLKVEKGDRPA
ncbi:MAG TPA: thiamine pyrophosphate-binding protein [bacterium]|nr:thiamine pyrophosphate-binding protein [bacterium]